MSDNKRYLKKESKVSIDEKHTPAGLEFRINVEDNHDLYTVAKCWDYLLAEKLRDAVAEYMKTEYKVVGQEDAEMIEEF